MSLEEEKGRLDSERSFLGANQYFPEALVALSMEVRTVLRHELVLSKLTGVRGSAISYPLQRHALLMDAIQQTPLSGLVPGTGLNGASTMDA